MSSFLCTGGTAPKVIEPLADKSSQAQKETTLQCKISGGEPRATVHWYRDGKELYDGKKYRLSYEKDAATLRVADSASGDSGNYRCEAVNKLGRVDTECKLTVECKSCLSLIYLFIRRLARMADSCSNDTRCPSVCLSRSNISATK